MKRFNPIPHGCVVDVLSRAISPEATVYFQVTFPRRVLVRGISWPGYLEEELEVITVTTRGSENGVEYGYTWDREKGDVFSGGTVLRLPMPAIELSSIDLASVRVLPTSNAPDAPAPHLFVMMPGEFLTIELRNGGQDVIQVACCFWYLEEELDRNE